MNKKSSPTLRDIARVSGFSLGTVSQALNHKPGVADTTRARVFEVAKSLGYEMQPPHTMHSPHTLTTIGLLIKQDDQQPVPVNPFYSHVLGGVERECQRHGLSLMFASVEVDRRNRVLNWPLLLLDGRVDGLIIVGAFFEDTLAQIDQHAQVVVLVDAYAPKLPIDSIVSDNLNGAISAVEYLIACGHTRIGLIGSAPDAYPSVRERRKGYTRALENAGISTAYIEDSMLTHDEGYAATLRLLRRSPEITAIFASNDEVALGVMDAAHELRRALPHDLSIVGFDNIDVAKNVKPGLTTVHVDKALMGTLGVRQLFDRFEDPARARLTITVGTELIVRESVRQLR
jgi:LacI family transcriptional regulator